MARLIESPMAVEFRQVVAGLPVVEFVEDAVCEVDEFVVPPRKTGGARWDHSFEVIEWLEC